MLNSAQQVGSLWIGDLSQLFFVAVRGTAEDYGSQEKNGCQSNENTLNSDLVNKKNERNTCEEAISTFDWTNVSANF